MNHEEYMKKVGPFSAGQFLRHIISRDELAELPDPSTLRRNEPLYSGDDLIVFEEAVKSFREGEMKPVSLLNIHMQAAFKSKDKRLFEIIAAAADFAETPNYNKHGRNVMAAMKAAAKIMIEEDRFPAKGEVRDAVIEELGLGAYGKTETSRWKEVYKAARISFLKKGQGKRGESKHGDKYRSPE